jgi:hypothetical protein
MSDSFVDTNLFIRWVTKDDPVKLAATSALFRQVESGILTLTAHLQPTSIARPQ